MQVRLIDLKNRVGSILDRYPHTRNDDMQLTFAIIWQWMPKEIISVEGQEYISTTALKMVREDNVKRIRAQFNKDGLFLPDNPEVRKQRRISEDEWRKFLNV